MLGQVCWVRDAGSGWLGQVYWFRFYYDIEGKDKDDNEDESSRPILNKKASTYACMQASSPMGKPALQRSNREDSTRMYSDVKLECQ